MSKKVLFISILIWISTLSWLEAQVSEIQVSYLFDQNYGFDQILQLSDTEFTKLKAGDQLNLGHTDRAIWVKVLATRYKETENWVFEISIPYLDTLDFYFLQDSVFQKIETGFHRPFESRKNQYSNFVFPVKIPSQSQFFYFRVRTSGPFLLPIEFSEVQTFHQNNFEFVFISGLFFGTLIALTVYNLLIFISLRDKAYGFNTLSMIALVLVMGSAEGYCFKYLWRDFHELNVYSISLSMVFLGLFSSLTARAFLNTRMFSPMLDKLILFFTYSGIVVALITLFTRTSYFANQYLTFTVPFFLITGVVCWVKGNRVAKFFVLAWSFYILGGVLVTLRNLGVLPFNFWTTYTSQIGSALEAVLLAFALSDRYRLIKYEKEEAMKKLLVSEQKNNQELENKVRDRTIEINEINAELEQVVEKLNESLEVTEQQKIELQKNHNRILSSINYAKRLQNALLPSEDQLNSFWGKGNYFIFNMPKDVLSGDFYFVGNSGSYRFVVVGDCTGHGIPGALLSIIGLSLLNEIIHVNGVLSPTLISNLIEYRVSELLFDKSKISDNIETAIIRIDTTKHEIKYCIKGMFGFLVEGDKIQELHKHRSSIHLSEKKTENSIHEDTLFFQPSAKLYLSSDGIIDQFGGKSNQKFGKKNLSELLLSISQNNFSQQSEYIHQSILNYMEQGRETQIDDMIVMGVELG
jgi:serine phosphatase RsbU (regulator of sigma subunit)